MLQSPTHLVFALTLVFLYFPADYNYRKKIRKSSRGAGNYTGPGKGGRCIRKVEKLKYELENNITLVSSKMTVDKWYDLWFDTYKKPTVKRSIAILYDEIYQSNVKPIIGRFYLEEVSGRMIQRVYSDFYEHNYARNSIEVCRSVMNGMFEQAFKEELIISNPVKKGTIPRARTEKEKIVMTKEQQQIFVEYVQKSELRDMILLAMYTGMRSAEIRGLQWKDIDFNTNTIYVNHTIVYNRGEYYLDEPKTKSSKREIPMITEAKLLLEDIKRKQLERKESKGSAWISYKGMENLVYTSPTGYPVNVSMVKNKLDIIIRKIRKQYPEFPDTTFHSLRHLFATRCVEGSMPFNVLQKILGHSRLAQTMDLYAHVLNGTKASEMEKIESILAGKKEEGILS